MSGYYCAPENNDYYFYVRTNNWAELWISTDENPANKRLVSASYGHSNAFNARPEQRSYPVTMAKGRSYYFEVVSKNYGSGMFTQVAMQNDYWRDGDQPQSMSLDNFSKAPRDTPQGFLTITPNKTKINPTGENVTLTADGCYFGKISWKAGSTVIQNPTTTLSIVGNGPGYYQAICSGDPSVPQDWVTVVIEPTSGLSPILNANTTTCANTPTTIAATNAPNGSTYRLYKFRSGGEALYNELNSYKDVFSGEFDTSIFSTQNITAVGSNPAIFTVSGPGRYWVRIISSAGWKYDVVPLTIAPAIPVNLKAVNNGPIAPGSSLTLSVGSVSNATYAWTKDGVTVGNTRMVFINDFTPDMAGIYSVDVNTAGCNTTKETTVEALECKVFISATNPTTGEETYKLTRSTTETDTFEPLTLSLSNYDGSADFSAYRIEWYHDGDLMTGKIQPTLSTALIGEYTARITLKSNPNTFCETTVTLSGTPCLELGDANEECDANYTVAAPDALASGITLSAGDEFTAGDFLVTVTEVTSGDKAGWNGEGYVSIKVGGIVELKRLAVTFDAAVVNSCYELSAGSVKTAYDPTWSNILDVDAVIEDVKKLLASKFTTTLDILQNFDGSCESLDELENLVDEIQAAYTSGNEEFPQASRSQIQANINDLENKIQQLKDCSCGSSSALTNSISNARASVSTSSACEGSVELCINSVNNAISSVYNVYTNPLSLSEDLGKFYTVLDYLYNSGNLCFNPDQGLGLIPARNGFIPICFYAAYPSSFTTNYTNVDLPYMSGILDGAYMELNNFDDNLRAAVSGLADLSELTAQYIQGMICYTSIYGSDEDITTVKGNIQDHDAEDNALWTRFVIPVLAHQIKNCNSKADQYLYINQAVRNLHDYITNYENLEALYNSNASKVEAFFVFDKEDDTYERYDKGKSVGQVITMLADLVFPMGGAAKVYKGVTITEDVLRRLITIDLGPGKKLADDVLLALSKRRQKEAIEALSSDPTNFASRYPNLVRTIPEKADDIIKRLLQANNINDTPTQIAFRKDCNDVSGLLDLFKNNSGAVKAWEVISHLPVAVRTDIKYLKIISDNDKLYNICNLYRNGQRSKVYDELLEIDEALIYHYSKYSSEARATGGEFYDIYKTKMDIGLDKLPSNLNHQGTSYGGYNFSDDLISQFTNNNFVEFGDLLSTSKAQGVANDVLTANNGNVLVEVVDGYDGKLIDQLTAFPEQEVLFHSEAVFKVKGTPQYVPHPTKPGEEVLYVILEQQ
jgi:hypothetical protein